MGDEVSRNSISIHLAIVFSILMLLSLMSLMTRVLLGGYSPTTERPINVLYDPDIRENFTIVCPYGELTTKYFKLQWGKTSCQNKTLIIRYNPWVRHWVWSNFTKKLSEHLKLKNNKLINLTAAGQEEAAESKQAGEEADTLDLHKATEPIESSNLVYVVLTLMVVLSTIIACFEIFRDKIAVFTGGETRGKATDRRCSLADFTIKRHLRKESQQETLLRQGVLEEEKVTAHGLVHQGSLDRAFSNVRPAAAFVRQSSVPSRWLATDLPLKLFNRQVSLEAQESSDSTLSRRKSRHFIRRH